MMDLMDVSSEIQESLGRSYNVPDDIDEDDLMGGQFFIIIIQWLKYRGRFFFWFFSDKMFLILICPMTIWCWKF